MNETTLRYTRQSRNTQSDGLTNRICRNAVLKMLGNLKAGRLTLIDGQTRQTFGTAGEICELHVKHANFYRRVLLGGSLGAAEAYIEGLWTTDDLTALLRLFVRNIELAHTMRTGPARVANLFARAFHWLNRNTQQGSRRNIHAHYDLGNDFFELFLDPTMTYSSGIFTDGHCTLEQASIEKLDRLCRKLDLQPSDHLLEIGTGWGSMAIHAAKNYGCRVTTTTISDEQYQLATDRVRKAELQDQITILKADYRDLTGVYDKIVSIEMIEAVGHDNLPTYFAKCDRLLKPEGLMALQVINMNEQKYAAYLRSVDFIQRYVFPGSCCPSIGALQSAIGKASNLRLLHMEDIGEHYAKTLAAWRDQFFANLEKVKALGCDEQFIRLWEYYLCYCEAGFAERYIGNSQMVLGKSGSSARLLNRMAENDRTRKDHESK